MSADSVYGTQLSRWLDTSAFDILDRLRLAVAVLYGARFRHTSREHLVVAFKDTDSIGKLNLSPNDIQIYASEE
ncbi:hypothetical protein BDN67DRAFT_973388 [Paxillus ammoniavirescens]|nr:hypothetical protein BDN67DRAFT_973388 [Paxillus ammoniavirescens]